MCARPRACLVGKTRDDMFVDVTIGVPNPEAVDTSAVAKELPYGTVTVTAVRATRCHPAQTIPDLEVRLIDLDLEVV